MGAEALFAVQVRTNLITLASWCNIISVFAVLGLFHIFINFLKLLRVCGHTIVAVNLHDVFYYAVGVSAFKAFVLAVYVVDDLDELVF